MWLAGNARPALKGMRLPYTFPASFSFFFQEQTPGAIRGLHLGSELEGYLLIRGDSLCKSPRGLLRVLAEGMREQQLRDAKTAGRRYSLRASGLMQQRKQALIIQRPIWSAH